jgi:hypothetical protein
MYTQLRVASAHLLTYCAAADFFCRDNLTYLPQLCIDYGKAAEKLQQLSDQLLAAALDVTAGLQQRLLMPDSLAAQSWVHQVGGPRVWALAFCINGSEQGSYLEQY